MFHFLYQILRKGITRLNKLLVTDHPDTKIHILLPCYIKIDQFFLLRRHIKPLKELRVRYSGNRCLLLCFVDWVSIPIVFCISLLQLIAHVSLRSANLCEIIGTFFGYMLKTGLVVLSLLCRNQCWCNIHSNALEHQQNQKL